MISARFVVFAITAIFCCSAFSITNTTCGINEARYPCGKRCEARCNAKIPGFCRGMMCLGFACRCKNGYARNPETDQCVEVNDCPANRCAPGEYLGACGTMCEGTCAEPSQPEVCQRMDCQDVSCRCDLQGGYVRDEISQKCVLQDDCPERQ